MKDGINSYPNYVFGMNPTDDPSCLFLKLSDEFLCWLMRSENEMKIYEIWKRGIPFTWGAVSWRWICITTTTLNRVKESYVADSALHFKYLLLGLAHSRISYWWWGMNSLLHSKWWLKNCKKYIIFFSRKKRTFCVFTIQLQPQPL